MKVKTKTLTDIFSKLKVAVSSKDFIEQTKHITFDGDYAFTFNGNVWVLCSFPTDFECCVPAQEFMNIVSDIKDDDVELTLEENIFKVSAGGLTAGLNTLEGGGDEKFNIGKDPELKPLPKDFKEAISICAFSASQDVSSHLNGIYVHGQRVISSDDYRISVYHIDSKIEDSLLIPLSSVLLLKDFDIVEYGMDTENNNVYFKDSDGALFFSRLIDSKEYENPDKYFLFEGTRMKFPPDMEQLVGKASILAKGDFDIDKRISITMKDQKLTCHGHNDTGWIKTFVDIKGNKTADFAINPQFFLQILNESRFAIIGENRILFKTDKYEHLIALHGEDED